MFDPVLVLMALLSLMLLLFVLSGIRYIPNNRNGIVEKRFSLTKGSVKSGFIALNGEAGYQPRVLRGGLHYLMPLQYSVHIMPLVTITQGKIGYVFARDGRPLEPTQVLASNAIVSDFQDAEGFLKESGPTRPAAPHPA